MIFLLSNRTERREGDRLRVAARQGLVEALVEIMTDPSTPSHSVGTPLREENNLD